MDEYMTMVRDVKMRMASSKSYWPMRMTVRTEKSCRVAEPHPPSG